MNNTFQSPAILSRISYLKDGGISLGFSTNELTDEEKLLISRYHNKFGYVLFKADGFQDNEIPTKDTEGTLKSHSKRLRASLYVLYDKKYKEKYLDFDTFYTSQMEKFIDAVKDKID